MAESENETSAGRQRLEEVAKLKRELQGPLRLIEKYEKASGEEKDQYENSIAKAYNDRRVLEERIKEVGTPKGSGDIGPLHVEWEVRGPEHIWVKLSASGGENEYEVTSEDATTTDEYGRYSTRRYAINGAPHGYFTVTYPQDDRPGSLSFGDEILAVW